MIVKNLRSLVCKAEKPQMTFEIHSFRFYGEPKLKTPAPLKGIKISCSVDYIPKKCKCPMYILGEDVWIKHRDYFSEPMKLPPEDFGAPLEVLANKYLKRNMHQKFVYPDTWGSIVLRNEAWLVIRGLATLPPGGFSRQNVLRDILRQQEQAHGWAAYSLDCSDMERFWWLIISEIWKGAAK